MKNKKIVRIMSFLLTLVLSLTLCTTSVLAAGNEVGLSYNSSADQYQGGGYNGRFGNNIYTAFGPTYRSYGQIMNNYFQVTSGKRWVQNYYLSIDPTYWADANYSHVSGTRSVHHIVISEETDGDFLKRYQFGTSQDYMEPGEIAAIRIHLKWLGNNNSHIMRYLNFNGGTNNYLFWTAPGTSDGTEPTNVEFYSTSNVRMN